MKKDRGRTYKDIFRASDQILESILMLKFCQRFQQRD